MTLYLCDGWDGFPHEQANNYRQVIRHKPSFVSQKYSFSSPVYDAHSKPPSTCPTIKNVYLNIDKKNMSGGDLYSYRINSGTCY